MNVLPQMTRIYFPKFELSKEQSRSEALHTERSLESVLN